MKPTLGRIVIYNTTKSDRFRMTEQSGRGQCNVRLKLPAVVVHAGDTDVCNLKVFFDGYMDLWAMDSGQGDGEGQWNWPVIAPATSAEATPKEDTQAPAIEKAAATPVDPTAVAAPAPTPEWVKPKSSWGD